MHAKFEKRTFKNILHKPNKYWIHVKHALFIVFTAFFLFFCYFFSACVNRMHSRLHRTCTYTIFKLNQSGYILTHFKYKPLANTMNSLKLGGKGGVSGKKINKSTNACICVECIPHLMAEMLQNHSSLRWIPSFFRISFTFDFHLFSVVLSEYPGFYDFSQTIYLRSFLLIKKGKCSRCSMWSTKRSVTTIAGARHTFLFLQFVFFDFHCATTQFRILRLHAGGTYENIDDTTVPRDEE